MRKLKILMVLYGTLAATSVSANEFVVAEFQADPEAPRAASSAIPNPSYGLYQPGNLNTEELVGTREASWSIGDYTFSGVVDWGHRANYWGRERYSNEHFFYLGSKFRVGDNSETYLYYGQDRDELDVAAELYGDFGDAETTRTGLSQTLFFADQQAQVGVGYEYATGDRDDVYRDLEGHEINVSGQLHIGWGISARLEAGYGLYSYGEYEGARGDVNSARTNMRAGIRQSFTPSLSWGAHYSYIDEDFVLSDLSRTRRTWGLNLEYRY